MIASGAHDPSVIFCTAVCHSLSDILKKKGRFAVSSNLHIFTNSRITEKLFEKGFYSLQFSPGFFTKCNGFNRNC